MNRDKIIDRIQKLLALAANNNSPEEAASAASKAQELMLRHNLDMATVEVADEETIDTTLVVERIRTASSKLATWKAMLWYGVCNGCGVAGYTTNGHRGMKAGFTAVGIRSSVDTATYMFRWLEKEINTMSLNALEYTKEPWWDRGDSRRWTNAYRVGAAETVARRLREKMQSVRAEATQSTALVRFDSLITTTKQAEASGLVHRTGSFKGGRVTSRDGLNAGRRDGNRVKLDGAKQLHG